MRKFFVLCVAWGIAQCAKPRRTSSKFHANNANNVKNLQCSKYSNTLRRIAGCVLVIFVGASMRDYVYAHTNIPVDTIHTLILPSELGNVVERYTGTTNEKVIVINDIHCDPETQRTISNIIITAKQVYGKHLRLIGIEGTRTGVIDTSIIRDIPNTRMRTDVTNYFVDRGDISGGELYAIATRDDVAVVGLEEPLLYRRNFNALYRSLAYRDSISQMCATIRRNIAPLKHYVYTDYARAIEQMQHAFDNGTVNAETYFSYLKTQAEKQNIDFRKRFPYIHTALQSYAIQKKINMPMVATEMRHLIAQLDAVLTNRERDALAILQKQGAASYYGYACELLSKKRVQWNTQYPQVQLYCSYLDCMRRVDAVKIMNESNACVQLLMAQALETRRDGQMLAGCEHYADAMESYICNTACQTDVETFMQQRSALFRVVHEVEERMMREHTITEHAAMLTAADATMDEFYVCAAQRNDVMTRLLLEQSRAVHSTVSVCIVGGFHREGITRALKSRGISYDVVIPVMNTNHESKWYVRRIKEQQLKMASFDKKKDVGLVAMRQSGVETAHFDNESVKKHNPLSMSHKGASLTFPFSKGEWEDALMVETNFGDGRFESVVFKQVCESVAQIKDLEVMRNFFEYYKPRLWDGVRITKSETEITFQVTKVTLRRKS